MVSYDEALSAAGVKPTRKGVRPEDALQIRTTKWLRIALPPDVPWSAIEHAQKATPRHWQILKAKGVRDGLPDYLFWPRARPDLAIELKVPPNGQSRDQAEFQEVWEASGRVYVICTTEQQVEAALKLHGITVRWPAPPPFAASSTKKPKRPARPRARKLTVSEARAQERVRSRTLF